MTIDAPRLADSPRRMPSGHDGIAGLERLLTYGLEHRGLERADGSPIVR